VSDDQLIAMPVDRARSGGLQPTGGDGLLQQRLSDVDEMLLSLSAKGLTHGEIAADLGEVYEAAVSKQTISPVHHQGHGRHGRMAEPAARRRLAGRLH